MKIPTFNITYFVLQTIAMILTCWLIPKLKITSIFGAIFMVIALAFINANVWDLALFMKVPDEATYQMVALFLTNGLLFWILVKVLPGIEVQGFRPALIAPVIFTVASVIVSFIAKEVDWSKTLEWTINFLNDFKTFIEAHFSDVQTTKDVLNKSFGDAQNSQNAANAFNIVKATITQTPTIK